jgi:hypothetical protein
MMVFFILFEDVISMIPSHPYDPCLQINGIFKFWSLSNHLQKRVLHNILSQFMISKQEVDIFIDQISEC